MFNFRGEFVRIIFRWLAVFLLICSIFISCKTKSSEVKEPPTVAITTDTSTTIVEKIREVEKPISKELGDVILERFKAVEGAVYRNDFDTWYKYLSHDYKKFLNNKEELLSLSSERVFLINNKIVLRTPEDYFKHVVVNARSGRAVIFDKFAEIDKYKVKVYCHIANIEDYKYEYYYVYQDNEWKLER